MNPYFLVKITKKSYADDFLNGNIFMQPLSAFGDLEKRKTDSNNAFRGDVLEGASQSFSTKEESNFFRDALSGEQSQPAGMGKIAEFFLQERVFCLYCLEYSESRSAFISPDRRVIDFGDTAVIIVDPLVLLRRICDLLRSQYMHLFWIEAKRVQYLVDLAECVEYNEFTKHKSYSWQNEYRIAVDLSNGLADLQAWDSMTDVCKIMFLNQGGKVSFLAKREPTVLRVGDIREACIPVSTNDLIDLRLPIDRMNNIAVPPASLGLQRQPIVTTYRPVIGW